MVMKICSKCNEEKKLSEFEFRKDSNNYRGQCKVCRKKYNAKWIKDNIHKIRDKRIAYSKVYNKKYRDKNRERLNHNSRKYYQTNKERISKYKKEYHKKNKDEIYAKRKEYFKKYQIENRDKINEYQRQWQKANPGKMKEYRKIYIKNNPLYKDNIKIWSKEYNKKYRNKNKEKINKIKSEYEKERRKTDPLYKLTRNMRTRIGNFMRYKGMEKTDTTKNMLGCSYDELMTYIEKKFNLGMTWDNQGQWHLDHIIPLASANNKEELYLLCHYSNLQPLWAEENLKKGSNILE